MECRDKPGQAIVGVDDIDVTSAHDFTNLVWGAKVGGEMFPPVDEHQLHDGRGAAVQASYRVDLGLNKRAKRRRLGSGVHVRDNENTQRRGTV